MTTQLAVSNNLNFNHLHFKSNASLKWGRISLYWNFFLPLSTTIDSPFPSCYKGKACNWKNRYITVYVELIRTKERQDKKIVYQSLFYFDLFLFSFLVDGRKRTEKFRINIIHVVTKRGLILIGCYGMVTPTSNYDALPQESVIAFHLDRYDIKCNHENSPDRIFLRRMIF